MKSYTAKAADLTKKDWVLIDAEGVVLGRMASIVAKILRGKHKATFTPSMDCGSNVVIINADKVKLTGRKREKEIHYWHTGHPGGVKQRTLGQILDGKFPERVIEKAVERMMPKESPLARKQMTSLKVYAGTDHPHTAQQPKVLDLASANAKNKREGN